MLATLVVTPVIDTALYVNKSVQVVNELPTAQVTLGLPALAIVSVR